MQRMRVILLAALALGISAAAWAQREVPQSGALGANNPIVDNDVVFRLDDESFVTFRDTITVDFVVVQRDTDSIGRIEATFYWDLDDLKYVTSRRGDGWPDTSLVFSATVTDTSFNCDRDGFTFVFDSTEAVIEVDFLVDCVNQENSTNVQFRFDSLTRPNENRFFRSTQDYWPGQFDDASITHDGGWPPTNTVEINCPGTSTIEIDDTVKVLALYNSSYQALGGVKTAWRWSSNLEYIGIDTSGTYLQGATLDTSQFSNDSLYVHTSDSIASTGPDTLFYLVFVDTASTDNVTDTAVNMWDTVFSGCDFLNVGETTADKHYVTIPEYTATIDIVDRSMSKSSTASVTVRLLNNFTVDMTVDQVDSSSAFHVDISGWQLITWADNISNSYGDYEWEQDADTTIVIENDSEDSEHIPKSTSYQNICTYDVTSGTSAGATTVGFTRIKGGIGEKQDSKLKAYNAPIVIYSFVDTANSIDSLFKLATGTVTVLTGGGGSCPFLMTWDGSEFIDENTILTQTEFNAEGVPVFDYYALATQPALKDGLYRLRIEERVDEISYIDEVRLLRFDVYPGRDLQSTADGEFFYAKQSLRPVTAVDFQGTDVLELVRNEDDLTYLCDSPGWLVVTYEPDETEAGRVFAGHAVAAKDIGCPPDGPGPKISDRELTRGDIRAIELEMAVREDGGSWLDLSATPPRDYNAPVFSATGLTIEAGKRIEVRYTWSERWEADQLPLIVASDEVPEPFELLPEATFHSVAGKISGTLNQADNEFMVLEKGQGVELHFPQGRRPGGGMDQVFVVAAKGYYIPAPAVSSGTLPTDFALHPNYPNPFNAQTRIDFALPSEADVQIEVFNVLGQRVKTLATGVLEAGEHLVIWDGTNDGGVPVASGVYFVQMRAGDFEQRRKMTLLK